MNGSSPIATARPAGRVRVYQASAHKLLASLPDRSIDLVITDPPYTSINRGKSGHLRDWFEHGLTWPQIGRVLAVARVKLKADGVLMAMTNNDGLRDAIGALERAGFIGIRAITWDRGYPGLGGGLRHQTEFVLVGRLTGSRTIVGVDLVSVPAVGPGTAGRYPTAKPDGLGRELAAMAGIGPGSLVVDPFCGSGALMIGAAERGASVVAGDVSRRAVRLAGARLARAGSVRGRSSTGRPSASSRSTTAVRPVKPAKPNGSSPSVTVARRNSPGKLNGSGRSTTVTRPARPGKPNGSGRSTTAVRPASTRKPNGSSRSSRTAKPARPGRPNGSGRRANGSRPASIGKPNGSSRYAPVTRPASPRKPDGSGRATRPASPTSRRSMWPTRRGSRP